MNRKRKKAIQLFETSIVAMCFYCLCMVYILSLQYCITYSLTSLITFRDPVHLAHTAVPLLLDLERILACHNCTPTSKDVPDVQVQAKGRDIDSVSQSYNSSADTVISSGLTVTLFSGHDINILALLFALKADIMTPPKADELKYWPDYGKFYVMIGKVQRHGVVCTLFTWKFDSHWNYVKMVDGIQCHIMIFSKLQVVQ